MKIFTKPIKIKPALASELLVTLDEFLGLYNKTIPEGYPKASKALLEKFKSEHESLFTHGQSWSLDQHRKRILDWLPQHLA